MTARVVTSASNIDRRALCPGSERMEAPIPPEADTPEAREGTLLHRYDADPKLDRARLKSDHRDLLRISEELDQFVFRRTEESYAISAPLDFTQEREVSLHYKIPGHADLVRIYAADKVAVVIDKKFGHKEQIAAALNYQLRAYAVMLAQKSDAQTIVVAITQPRLTYGERVTMAAYGQEDIALAREELDAITQAYAAPDAPLVAGLQQCRYCRAKIKCPAYAEIFSPLQVKPKLDLELATPSQIDKLLRAIAFADFIKEQVRDIARGMVSDGRLEGWRLGAATRMRKIIDPARAISLLLLRGDLTKDQILECCTPSITKLREKLRAQIGCTHKEANVVLDEVLTEVLELVEKKPSLIANDGNGSDIPLLPP